MNKHTKPLQCPYNAPRDGHVAYQQYLNIVRRCQKQKVKTERK